MVLLAKGGRRRRAGAGVCLQKVEVRAHIALQTCKDGSECTQQDSVDTADDKLLLQVIYLLSPPSLHRVHKGFDATMPQNVQKRSSTR